MRYYLSCCCVLKHLEFPSVYKIPDDELYELDKGAFEFLKKCGDKSGCDGGQCDREFLGYAIREGILTNEGIDIKRPSIRKSPEPSLRYLELQITRKCNLQCRHCYIGPSETVELPLKKIQDILTEFEEMQGLRLLITGGEPLLHRQFQEINNILPDYAFRKILFTNGLLLKKEILKTLKVDEIQISVDGLESGHEALRGEGTFKKTMSAIETAIHAGFAVSISTMVHSKNLDDFDEMERLFRDIGVREWTVDVPCVEGNLRENPLFQLNPEVAGPYLRYGFGEGLHGGGEGFACGLHLASVMADGKAAKCAFYRDSPVGSVDEGLCACWKRIVPVRLNELQCDCVFIELCRGGCRYRAELSGNRLGKDFYRCFAMTQAF